MAEYKYSYRNRIERQIKIAEAEAKGLTMLHDDFNPDWKSGDKLQGVMTFVTQDELPEPPPTEPSRDLAAELDALKKRITEIEEK